MIHCHLKIKLFCFVFFVPLFFNCFQLSASVSSQGLKYIDDTRSLTHTHTCIRRALAYHITTYVRQRKERKKKDKNDEITKHLSFFSFMV